MKFGGLSQKEAKVLTDIFDSHRIPYELMADDELLEINRLSMRNNLRHFNPPSITTHILAVEVRDEDLEKLSEATRILLRAFGDSRDAPEFTDLPEKPSHVQKELLLGNKRVVGMNFMLHALVGLLLLAVYVFLRGTG